MDGKSGRISELPSSVVIEILRRLPLKTLVRCRHVCKAWNAMLSETYFYKLYSTHTPTILMIQVKGDNMEPLRNIYIVETNEDAIISRGVYIKFHPKRENSYEDEEENGVRDEVVEEDDDDDDDALEEEDDDDDDDDDDELEEEDDDDELEEDDEDDELEEDDEDDELEEDDEDDELEEEEEVDGLEEEEEGDDSNFKYQLGNSCNGLICLRELRSREPIVIWNPIMGQYVNLPTAVTTSDDKVVAGFGFSPRSKVYKVLRIIHEKETSAAKWVAEIYDFGMTSSTWRRIGDAPCAIPSRIPGFFINSSLHWILNYTSSSAPNQLICSFDFNIEGFKFVAPPPIYSLHEKTKYHWSNLGILAGCLSICAIDAKNFRPDVQVWVMCEYGDPESWIKKLSIRDPAVDWWDPYRWIQVTNFLKNGEILLLCSHRYVLAYDPETRTFLNQESLNFPAIAHVPSFISLKSALREDGPLPLDVKYL